MIANHIPMSFKTETSTFMPSWKDLEVFWLEAPSIVVRKSLEKCGQGGKDAPISNQGHEAGDSLDCVALGRVSSMLQIQNTYIVCTYND